MRKNAAIAILCSAAFLAGCSGGAPASETAAEGWGGTSTRVADREVMENGQRIATQQCAVCHAIDRTSQSPRLDAPPLRNVLAVYDTDDLAYRFIEGMKVGHDAMPQFDFDVRAADDLLAFIASISAP